MLSIQSFFEKKDSDQIASFSSTEQEIAASSIPITFRAKTTWGEKTMRIIHGVFACVVFFPVLRKVVNFIPQKITAPIYDAAAKFANKTLEQGMFLVFDLANKTPSDKPWKIIFTIYDTVDKLSPKWKQVAPVAFRCLKVGVGLYVARKVVACVVSLAVYPAIVFSFLPYVRCADPLDIGPPIKFKYPGEIVGAFKELQKEFLVKMIRLEKSGSTYDGYLVGHRETIHNGNWKMHAFGNGEFLESGNGWILSNNATNNYRLYQANTLFINGPMVGRNWSFPTRFGMGAAYEAGMQFLETFAKKIIIEGNSLGGGMIGEAVLQHDFTYSKAQNIKYLNITRVSFNQLSQEAPAYVAGFLRIVFRQKENWNLSILTPILRGLGVELDGTAASKKLTKERIKQIVVNNPNKRQSPDNLTDGDSMIATCAILSKDIDTEDEQKIVLLDENIGHDESATDYPKDISNRLIEEQCKFFDVPVIK